MHDLRLYRARPGLWREQQHERRPRHAQQDGGDERASEIVPLEFRATGVGIMNAVAATAGGCGVLLAGFLKREVGLAGIFAGISGCFLTAGGILLIGYGVFIRRDIARAKARAAASDRSLTQT